MPSVADWASPPRRESPGIDRGFCRWVGDDPRAQLYLRPLTSVVGSGGFETVEAVATGPRRRETGSDRLLAGGLRPFQALEVILRAAPGGTIFRALGTIEQIRDWADGVGRLPEVEWRWAALIGPRPSFAGLSLDRPRIMGIVNTTPDSFSDGGDFQDRQRAIDQGHALAEAGCDVLDIGGESTRPGAEAVSEAEEMDRVLPVIEALAGLETPISIDTRRAGVMRAAIDAGARIINDVTALQGDPESAAVAGALDVPVVLMHMQGQPRTMQTDPRYDYAPLDIADRLDEYTQAAIEAGVDPSRIVIDPGIGFGKSVAHNVDVLRHSSMLHMYGFPVLIGLSRKRFLGAIGGAETPKDRLPASLAAGLIALQQGAQILRVHDGAATVQAVRLLQALL